MCVYICWRSMQKFKLVKNIWLVFLYSQYVHSLLGTERKTVYLRQDFEKLCFVECV